MDTNFKKGFEKIAKKATLLNKAVGGAEKALQSSKKFMKNHGGKVLGGAGLVGAGAVAGNVMADRKPDYIRGFKDGAIAPNRDFMYKNAVAATVKAVGTGLAKKVRAPKVTGQNSWQSFKQDVQTGAGKLKGWAQKNPGKALAATGGTGLVAGAALRGD